MDAVTAHNKGQFLHLSKLTGLKRVACDGWFRVNLFDTLRGNGKKNKNLAGPSYGGSKLILCYFIRALSCFKGHAESSGKMSEGQGHSH